MSSSLSSNDGDPAASLPSRLESDSMGLQTIPAGRLWGAQTQRSLHHFPIGGIESRMPFPIVYAMATVKKSCALYNKRIGKMEGYIADAIAMAADEIIAGKLDLHFPLVIFQTGSGTQVRVKMQIPEQRFRIRIVTEP